MSDVGYGEPFFMSVTEGCLDGHISAGEDLGLVYPCGFERDLIAATKSEVQKYGGGQRIYVCIPLGRVWTDDPGADDDGTNAPNRVVTVDMAETLIERMAAAAAAMGVSGEGARY